MKKSATPAINLVAFAQGLLAAAIARAFTPPPDIPIYDWADENVWLYSEDAAEPGPYRSNKTCWTRRLQELGRNPVMWCWDYGKGQWVKVRVTEIDIQKSTQSGFTEAILNIIRWIASFIRRNVIYLVDSQDQGKKIARRLLRSLKRLDPAIFSGNPDDLKSLEFLLRGMEIIFGGSFSGTTTAQKQAPVVVADEIEEHKQPAGDDTSATRNLKYRKKTSTGGLQFNLGKPKLQGGPINRLFNRGSREEFHIACPHCHYLQPIIPAYQNSCSQTTEIDTPFSDKFLLIDAATEKVIREISALDVGRWALSVERFPKNRKRGDAKCTHRSAKNNENSAGSSIISQTGEVAANVRSVGCDYVLLPKPLPLGKTRKIKTGKLCYHHCKDLLGGWDMLSVLNDTFFECGNCKQRIDEHDKHRLALDAAERDPQMLGWLPTAIGSPGVVSMHMGDMLSLNEESSWGEIARQLIEAKAESRTELQGVINNIFGNTWKEELANTKPDDIRANVAGKDYFFLDVQTDQGTKREVFDSETAAETARKVLMGAGEVEVGTVLPSFCKPYKRGNIPFLPQNLILGSDVGGNYARWVVIAVCPNMIDAAVIDWGDELDPESIAEIVLTSTWPCLADNKKRRIGYGFIDSHWRTNDVLRACWHVLQIGKSHRLIPTAMIGGTAARGMRVWTFHHIQGYRAKSYRHTAFKQLGYNFRESMNDTFITCIQKKRRRIWFPAELAQSDRDLDHDQRQFIEELCNDKMVEDRHGRKMWADPPPGPNHYGAALKNAVTGLRFLTRKHHLTGKAEESTTEDTKDTETE